MAKLTSLLLLCLFLFLSACTTSSKVGDASAIERSIAGIGAPKDNIYLIVCGTSTKSTEVLDFYEGQAFENYVIEHDSSKVIANIKRLSPELAEKIGGALKHLDDYDFSIDYTHFSAQPTGVMPRDCELVPYKLTFDPHHERKEPLSKANLKDYEKRGILIHYLLWRDDPKKGERKSSQAVRKLNAWFNSVQLNEANQQEYAELLNEFGLVGSGAPPQQHQIK